MEMDVLLMVIAGILIVVGFIGCVMPAVPGPLLGYAGLIVMCFSELIGKLGTAEIVVLVVLGIATLIIIVADYVIPSLLTTKFGGSKWAALGSAIGLIVGLVAPIPCGFIVGPFAGALIAEYLVNKDFKQSMKSGAGSLVGFLLMTAVKLTLVSVFLAVYGYEIFRIFVNNNN